MNGAYIYQRLFPSRQVDSLKKKQQYKKIQTITQISREIFLSYTLKNSQQILTIRYNKRTTDGADEWDYTVKTLTHFS